MVDDGKILVEKLAEIGRKIQIFSENAKQKIDGDYKPKFTWDGQRQMLNLSKETNKTSIGRYFWSKIFYSYWTGQAVDQGIRPQRVESLGHPAEQSPNNKKLRPAQGLAQ